MPYICFKVDGKWSPLPSLRVYLPAKNNTDSPVYELLSSNLYHASKSACDLITVSYQVSIGVRDFIKKPPLGG